MYKHFFNVKSSRFYITDCEKCFNIFGKLIHLICPYKERYFLVHSQPVSQYGWGRGMGGGVYTGRSGEGGGRTGEEVRVPRGAGEKRFLYLFVTGFSKLATHIVFYGQTIENIKFPETKFTSTESKSFAIFLILYWILRRNSYNLHTLSQK